MEIDKSIPFSKWSKEELQKVLNQCINEHVTLLREPNLAPRDFISKKRDFVQPVVNHIYNEIFYGKRFFIELWLTEQEIERLRKFAEDYVEYKIRSGEPGWSRDKTNGVGRVFTGAAGHLAVLKSLGGSIEDMDLTIGPSKKYNLPDMLDWLGYPVGVKTASVIDYTPKYRKNIKNVSNLPLVLDYKKFDKNKIKKWTRDNLRFEERVGVESQIIVATKDFKRKDPLTNKYKIYKTKCYILGVVNPEALINFSSIAFTLDRAAADESKAGGAKAGFYGLNLIEPFKTKKELIEIIKKPDHKLIPYEEINGHVDMANFYDFTTKQSGI